MALEILGSTLAEAFKCLGGFLYSKISTIFKYQTNINSLINQRSRLADVKKSIKDQLELANKEGKVPTPKVETWLQDVEKIEEDLKFMVSEITANDARLHRDAQRKAEEVKKLVSSGFPSGVAVVDPGLKVVEQIPGPPVEGQKTALEMMDEILKLLSDDRIRKIGIWGMGGVGKTTLVRTLNNKLEDSSSPQLFDIVIWITVSKGTDVKTIQYRLIERLKMSTGMPESTEGRAIRLCERLKMEKKILLILDDVWEKIDLDKVGIPHGDAHPGCKIILTTRSFDVCREMETDKEMKVNVLSEEDAWKMFSKSAGDVVELKEIKSHAKDVSKECGGLPLALITVGKAMREKEQPELWKNALYALRRSAAPDIRGVEREVYLPLKLSYDSLQGKNIKPCFLYCIMYPEDHSIEVSELVRCWMAEGLIDESDDLEVLFNLGFAVVENLIDSCMLERGHRKRTVKMHDVVRDVAIWIASSSEPEFKTFARPGTGLTNFPKESMKESLRRVSLMNNEIEKLPPDRLMTNSKLLSFLLQGNPLKDIPEELFVGLRALRVLNLSSTRLKKLPLSLGSLGDLRQLNLSYTPELVNIPAGVFARLSCLEELEMRHSAYKWDVSGPQSMGRATFNELGSLMHLRLLYIDVQSVTCLSLDLSWLKKLKKFNICVGSRGDFEFSNTIEYNERIVVLSSIDLSGEAHFDELLANASALLLRDCRGIRSICELVESGTRAFIGLKSLVIRYCKEMTCVIKGELGILPNLEVLELYGLPNLEYIVEGMIPYGESLTKLRIISVLFCPALQWLIMSALLPHVQSLEKIDVAYCSGMSALMKYKEMRSGH